MNKIMKNKKLCVAILIICILILVGVIIAVAVRGDKDDTEIGKGSSKQEVIVHESDKDTVEEKAEGGLTESDSEDGPVLDEDKMIDFNGSDAKTEDDKTDSASSDSDDNAGEDNNADDSTDENPKEEEDEESKDTGSWGAFY